MKRFGIFGWPLDYSLSPEIHNAAFKQAGLDWSYELLPTKSEDLAAAVIRFREESFGGANVTIPHKEKIIPFLDGLTDTAAAIGAVNTLFWKHDKLIGDNTDAPGFLEDLRKKEVRLPGMKALVLGAGGSAKAIGYALFHGHADNIETWTRSSGAMPMPGDITVNCTPGLSPEYLEEIQFGPGQVLYDLVYDPEETPLMKKAIAGGAKAFNGKGMLLEQAALSFEIWRTG
ncbi:MAG: shikimate dehydrogenase [Myxococcota bacterium]